MVSDSFNSALARARENTTIKVALAVAASAIVFGAYKVVTQPKDAATLTSVQQALVNASGPSRVGPADMKSLIDLLSTSGAADPILVATGKEKYNRGHRAFSLKGIYKSFLSKILPSSSGFVAVASKNADAAAIFSPTGVVKSTIPTVYDSMNVCYTGFSRRGRPEVASTVFALKRNRILSKYPSAYYIFSVGASSTASGTESLKSVITSISDLATKNNVPTIVEITDATLIPVFESLGFSLVEEFSLFDVQVSVMKK